VRVERILHAHFGVLQEEVQVIELLIRVGGVVELLLWILNRAVAEGVGFVLVLVPLRDLVLHFETHCRLLLGGGVADGLRLLLHQRRSAWRAYLVMVGLEVGRLHLIGHPVDMGARVVVSLRGGLILKLDLSLLELACLDL
jgi:hypothetical protein